MPCQDDGQGEYYARKERQATQVRLDRVTEMLCRLCSQNADRLPGDINEWFRKHQEADRKRLAAELAAEVAAQKKAAALAKLTPEEKRMLGLK
jgi:predicted RNA-binding protein Jag